MDSGEVDLKLLILVDESEGFVETFLECLGEFVFSLGEGEGANMSVGDIDSRKKAGVEKGKEECRDNDR